MSKKFSLDITQVNVCTDAHMNRVVPLYRVKAEKTFMAGDGEKIEAGTYGGWLESESCLSQEGGAWVGRNAKVFNGSSVEDESVVTDDCFIRPGVRIHGIAFIDGKVHTKKDSVITVFGNDDSTHIGGNITLSGNCAFKSAEISCYDIETSVLEIDSSSFLNALVYNVKGKIKNSQIAESNLKCTEIDFDSAILFDVQSKEDGKLTIRNCGIEGTPDPIAGQFVGRTF